MNKGIVLVLATAVISGVSIFINAFGVKGINPDIFTFTKNLLVALVLVSIILVARQWKNVAKLKRKDWTLLTAIGLIGGSVPFILFFRGLQLSSAATGSFIQKIMFVFVAAFAMIWLKEDVKKYIIPGLLLLIGNFFLLNMTGFTWGMGEWLILAATVLWALENALSKKAVAQAKIPGTIVAAARMGIGAVFLAAYLLFNGTISTVSTINYSQAAWIGVTAVFLLGYVLTWYNGIKNVSITLATALLQVGAPITMLLQYAFLHKEILIIQGAGIILVTGSVAYLVAQSSANAKAIQANSTA